MSKSAILILRLLFLTQKVQQIPKWKNKKQNTNMIFIWVNPVKLLCKQVWANAYQLDKKSI